MWWRQRYCRFKRGEAEITAVMFCKVDMGGRFREVILRFIQVGVCIELLRLRT